MTLTGDSQVRFSELDQKELAEYRPLNRFAIVACVFGCFACVALIHPILCLVPLLGIITALLAFRHLHSLENKQTGRLLAIIGLFLSVLFGSWAVARESSRELRLYCQARQFAEGWFALLRDGRFYEAHQLTVKEAMRAASGVSLEKHYAPPAQTAQEKMQAAMKARSSSSSSSEDPDKMLEMMEPSPHDGFETFFKQPTAKRLRELGSKGHYEFRENVQILPSTVIAEQVELKFVVSEQGDGSSNSFPVIITLEREFQAGVADWSVTSISDSQSQ